MDSQPAQDPRPLFGRALDQMGEQVAAVRPEELGARTPCAEYDVRALLGHVVAVLDKLARVGAGGDTRGLPDVVEGVPDSGWAAAFARARGAAERVWADDARLDGMVALPWATMPGRDVVDAYTHEFTAHSWDLAHATGRLAGLDPDLAERALRAFAAFAPPEERDERGRFGPVVPVSEDAGAYERLAAYLGRRP
ncbi:TIGR03086 family metal-binding protein [Streptomyces albiaxialis]|uniref:TIGR03086 family metal-binding protein n=1 Tax=Streptomyces albiaxialis TaxID=329523 RepID=A0ABN2VW64_9ACTN